MTEKCKSNMPVTVDGATLTVIPPPRINLKSVDGVRLEMARVYREMKTGNRDMSEGGKLAYVLSLIGKLIETGELAKRIEAIEDKITKR